MTTNSFALSRAIKLLSFPRFSLWSPSRCLTKPRFSLWSPSHHCHQASLFYPITKPLFESPSLCLCRFTLTHLQIRFTVTKPCFSLRSPSRYHQASLFSLITKPLSESLSLCLYRFILTHHQIRFIVTKPCFSLRSLSRCPNHQASASASADSLKLRRSLK